MTLDHAAEQCGVTPRTLRRWVRQHPDVARAAAEYHQAQREADRHWVLHDAMREYITPAWQARRYRAAQGDPWIVSYWRRLERARQRAKD